MASLAPFLPPHLVRSLAKRGAPKHLPHIDRFPAALLLSDITGFTALTERLQARGRGGAEEIAATINAAFAPAIRAIEKESGSIVSFGGDALFAIFPGVAPVARATAAANAIRDLFAKRGRIATSAGKVTLGMSQAVHYGDVQGLHLGTAERRHYLVVGDAVAGLARLEAKASGGKLLVSPASRALANSERGDRTVATAVRRAPASRLRSYLPDCLLPLLGKFEGEYRRVAALFLETKGTNPAVLNAFFLALVDILDRYEGVLLKTDLSAAGTKWLCVLGIPQAHEEDPDRAARAGLDVVAAVPERLAVRGGLHAGIVANIMVGTTSRRALDVMGDVVNSAARTLAQAPWGEVLVTEETRKLLAGVDTEARGKHAVKGKKAVLELHALKAARSIVKQIRVLAPMIGRDAELAQIVEALSRAKDGKGSAIGIKGEPGLGKSRLKHEAAKVAREMGFDVHEGRAISFGGMAYWTISALLKDALGLQEVPDKESILTKVSTATERLGMKPVDRHHLADVLGARYPESPIEHLQPKDVRLNAMIAVRAFATAIAKEKPRLLVLEDMHWTDGASAEAAEWLTKGAKDAPCVVLLLYRPGYELPRNVREIRLHDLGDDAVGKLLEAHLGMVPPAVLKLVRERAGGNPFYVEEVVRHLLEAGILGMSDEGYQLVREPRAEDLPDSVESLIAARLDRLSADVKNVAQHAAVIGRRFLFELLANLPHVGGTASTGVEELCRRELTFELGRDPRLEYVFKHAITRDVAYSSILASRRRKLHAMVANVLEDVLAGERDSFLAMLGHHREEAGEKKRARKCYLAGARHAAQRYAHAEAERLYRRYLALVATPTEESIKARSELGAKLELRGLMDEAEAELRTALEGAQRLRSKKLEGVILRTLGVVMENTGRIDEARKIYGQALEIHRAQGDHASEAITLGNLAVHLHDQGRLNEARSAYEKALVLKRRVGDRRGEGIALGNLAGIHHHQGRPREALALLEQALAIHREIRNRRSEGIVLGNIALLRHAQGEVEAAESLSMQALAIHREVGDRRFEGLLLGNLALSHRDAGKLTAARDLLEQALFIHRETDNRQSEATVLGNLAGLHALMTGDLMTAATLAAQSEQILSGLRDQLALLSVLLEQGYLELALGRSAAGLVARYRDLLGRLSLPEQSDLSRALAMLERAEEALLSRQPLVCGRRPDDLSTGQLRWLREHRPEAIPPSVMARLNEDGTLRPVEPSAAPARPARGK